MIAWIRRMFRGWHGGPGGNGVVMEADDDVEKNISESGRDVPSVTTDATCLPPIIDRHEEDALDIGVDLFSRDLFEAFRRRDIALRLEAHTLHSVGTCSRVLTSPSDKSYDHWYMIGQGRGCTSTSVIKMCGQTAANTTTTTTAELTDPTSTRTLQSA